LGREGAIVWRRPKKHRVVLGRARHCTLSAMANTSEAQMKQLSAMALGPLTERTSIHECSPRSMKHRPEPHNSVPWILADHAHDRIRKIISALTLVVFVSWAKGGRAVSMKHRRAYEATTTPGEARYSAVQRCIMGSVSWPLGHKRSWSSIRERSLSVRLRPKAQGP
jgi:hypothetical protein